MILPGTRYKITKAINSLGEIGSRGSQFLISLKTDPRDENLQIEFKDSNEDLFLTKTDLNNSCELISDFGEAIYFYTSQEKYQ